MPRAVFGIVLLVPLAVLHAGHYFRFERDIADALHDLPDGVLDAAKFAYELSSLWALGIVVIGVLVALPVAARTRCGRRRCRGVGHRAPVRVHRGARRISRTPFR